MSFDNSMVQRSPSERAISFRRTVVRRMLNTMRVLESGHRFREPLFWFRLPGSCDARAYYAGRNMDRQGRGMCTLDRSKSNLNKVFLVHGAKSVSSVRTLHYKCPATKTGIIIYIKQGGHGKSNLSTASAQTVLSTTVLDCSSLQVQLSVKNTHLPVDNCLGGVLTAAKPAAGCCLLNYPQWVFCLVAVFRPFGPNLSCLCFRREVSNCQIQLQQG